MSGQAVTSTLVAAAPLWGLAVLKFDVKLPFHVNDADLLRILKETPMSGLSSLILKALLSCYVK
jgi:hypothetical protein